MELLCTQEVDYCYELLTHDRGNPLVLTIYSLLFIAHWPYKRELIWPAVSVYREIYLVAEWTDRCLVQTNSWINLVGVIHTREQYSRSHSTAEDFISLIVAVFLNKQSTAVWLKFGVLDFCRKRLIGVGSTLTFVENDQGVGLLWHLRKGLYSVTLIFSSISL